MAELKRTEEAKRILKIYLKGKLEMDSDGVNFNFRGVVIDREFVGHIEHLRIDREFMGHIEHLRESDMHVLTMTSGVWVHEVPVTTDNGGEACIRFYKDPPYRDMYFPVRLIGKIEKIESRKVTLVP